MRAFNETIAEEIEAIPLSSILLFSKFKFMILSCVSCYNAEERESAPLFLILLWDNSNYSFNNY